MSDWSMYELDDITWGVFGDCCESEAYHPDIEQLNCKLHHDSHKKARHDVAGSIEWNPRRDGLTGEKDYKEKEEAGLLPIEGISLGEYSLNPACQKAVIPECSMKAATLTSDHTITDDSVLCRGHYDKLNEFCSDDSVLEDTSISDKNSLKKFSSADNDLDMFLGPKDVINDDIFDYEWPDIGNFEDVDQMLSTDYSHFGQECSRTANELSWFSPSSHTIDGSEEGLQSGFQSSYTDLSSLREPMEDNETTEIKCTRNGDATICSYHSSPSYKSCGLLDTSAQDGGFSSEAMVGMLRDASKCIPSKSKGKEKTQNSDCACGKFYRICQPMVESSGRVTSQVRLSPVTTQLNGTTGTYSLDSLHTYDFKSSKIHSKKSCSENVKGYKKANKESNEFSENNIAVAASHVHQPKMASHCPSLLSQMDKDKIEEASPGMPFHGRPYIGNSIEKSLSQRNLFQLESLVESESDLDAASRDSLKSENCQSSMQDNSGPLMSDDTLCGPTSLRHLQSVMDRLDLRIKLCIRDGLYRLARNAQQRHGVDGTESSENAPRQDMGIHESKRCPEFMVVETGTNPIDRSIAHLLFYRASEQSPRPTNNDAMSC